MVTKFIFVKPLLSILLNMCHLNMLLYSRSGNMIHFFSEGSMRYTCRWAKQKGWAEIRQPYFINEGRSVFDNVNTEVDMEIIRRAHDEGPDTEI